MNKFTVFLKTGGPGDNNKLILPFWKKMNTILDLLSKTKYTNIPIQFHIAIRIDGEIVSYGDPDGCSNLKFFKKKSLIGNTIAISNKLFNSLGFNVGAFLKENFRLSIKQMTNKLKNEKIEVDEEMLLLDLNLLLDKNW